MPLTFANPRLEAVIPDYPLGGGRRGPCRFFIERHPRRGYRAGRVTFGKPKYDTYGGRAAVVDGSDGRTYIIQDAGPYGFIRVSRSDFKDADALGLPGNSGAVFPSGDTAALHAELAALLASAYAPATQAPGAVAV